MTAPTISTLDELLDVLTSCSACLAGSDPIAIADGDAPAHTCGGLEWADLPTFGGAEPRDTTGVWSWDETRLLTGTCANDLRIDDRTYEYTVRSEGDAPETIEATDPRAAAAEYASGQDWRDCDEEVSQYQIHVTDANGRAWSYAARTGENGFGQLTEGR